LFGRIAGSFHHEDLTSIHYFYIKLSTINHFSEFSVSSVAEVSCPEHVFYLDRPPAGGYNCFMVEKSIFLSLKGTG